MNTAEKILQGCGEVVVGDTSLICGDGYFICPSCQATAKATLSCWEEEHKKWLNLLINCSEIGMSGYECNELCKYKYLIMSVANSEISHLTSQIKILKEGIK